MVVGVVASAAAVALVALERVQVCLSPQELTTRLRSAVEEMAARLLVKGHRVAILYLAPSLAQAAAAQVATQPVQQGFLVVLAAVAVREEARHHTQAARATRLQLTLHKAIMAEMAILMLLMLVLAVAAAHRLSALTEQARRREMAVMAPHQVFPAHLLPTQAEGAAVHKVAPLEQAALAEAATELIIIQPAAQARPIQVVVAEAVVG